MLSRLLSCALTGLEGHMILVEVDISRGLPAFEIVGLPDTAVKESKERVRSAIKNSGFDFPVSRMTVNLAPAYIKKAGPYYDLPICLGLLESSGQIKIEDRDDYMFIGELSLSGELRPVLGALPMVMCGLAKGITNFIIPEGNAKEASVVENANIYPAKTLKDIVNHFSGEKLLEKCTADISALFAANNKYDVDFSEVKGQGFAKRALEIAAAGGHNILLIGPPGSGKTMLAKRIPSILPDLTFNEALDVTKIHSVAGTLPDDVSLIVTRPFRSPHHTVSAPSLSGGGSIPKPGEISLAHNGVLFLDELPEFSKDALEVMRQPIEDRVVTISRVGAKLTYPSDFMMVAAMNPCKCGYYGDPSGKCKCSQKQIGAYLGKISGPMLDRIDLHVEVSSVKYKELEDTTPAESSQSIKERVDNARKIQIERYKDHGIYSNAQLTPALMDKFCQLDEEASMILRAAFERLGLSARAYDRILKVSRTIADLEGEENILTGHIAEAIRYRSLDRKYWQG